MVVFAVLGYISRFYGGFEGYAQNGTKWMCNFASTLKIIDMRRFFRLHLHHSDRQWFGCANCIFALVEPNYVDHDIGVLAPTTHIHFHVVNVWSKDDFSSFGCWQLPRCNLPALDLAPLVCCER